MPSKETGKLLFISHAHSDRVLANYLRNEILEIFDGKIEVFVSSSDESNPLGTNWLGKVNRNLKKCKAMFVLCSEASVTRTWVAFETGAGWAKGIKVVPICVKGLLLKDLQLPFSQLNGVNLEYPNSVERLLNLLSLEFDIQLDDEFLRMKIKAISSGIRDSEQIGVSN
jgi:hypothetical protein